MVSCYFIWVVVYWMYCVVCVLLLVWMFVSDWCGCFGRCLIFWFICVCLLLLLIDSGSWDCWFWVVDWVGWNGWVRCWCLCWVVVVLVLVIGWFLYVVWFVSYVCVVVEIVCVMLCLWNLDCVCWLGLVGCCVCWVVFMW